MQYHLMNADLWLVCKLSAREIKNGTVFKLPKTVETCPWKAGPKEIPAGTYKLVSRKFFVGGVLVVEAV